MQVEVPKSYPRADGKQTSLVTEGGRVVCPLFAMISDCQRCASRFHFVKAAEARSTPNTTGFTTPILCRA